MAGGIWGAMVTGEKREPIGPSGWNHGRKNQENFGRDHSQQIDETEVEKNTAEIMLSSYCCGIFTQGNGTPRLFGKQCLLACWQ
jgi:hypothetical protein